MTRLAEHGLCQKAVLWAAATTAPKHDEKGRPIVAAAVEVNCRWVEVQREGSDAQGNTVAITAEVVVDRDVPLDSIMWLGEKEDLATPPVDLMKVVDRVHTPCVRNRATRRELSLARYSDTLPELG